MAEDKNETDKKDEQQAAAANVLPAELSKEMRTSFLEYSMSVIVSRALPDVRDGLKPVHRRILYAMNESGITPKRPHAKSARTVGDVIGKYHPHGDSAVYDTMVRLAQPFSMRVPLVDGHGNFGSIDGDSAAAMRYTEARLDKPAMELLRDLDKETVDFQPNYDESLQEPVVLPSRFPNLLVNGSSGIAVGMATNIPPHNLGEAIDATCMMIDNPDCTVDDLMKVLPGPDFPTGGIIMGRKGIRDAYETGKGSLTIRSKCRIEEGKNGKHSIVVSEIPYQVNRTNLLKKIADLVKSRIEVFPDIDEKIDFFQELPEYDTEMYVHKKMKSTKETSLSILQDVVPLLEAQEDFSNDALYELLSAYVQEKGYKASFPSLINVAGVPTYIMVLKDAGGLVKMYAMVNVSQYNMVATATSQTEVFTNYKKMLAKSGKSGDVDKLSETKDIVVSDVKYIDTDDGTMVYVKDSDGDVYKQAFADNEQLIKLNVGDRIEIKYEPSEDGINYMTSYEYIEKQAYRIIEKGENG